MGNSIIHSKLTERPIISAFHPNVDEGLAMFLVGQKSTFAQTEVEILKLKDIGFFTRIHILSCFVTTLISHATIVVGT